MQDVPSLYNAPLQQRFSSARDFAGRFHGIRPAVLRSIPAVHPKGFVFFFFIRDHRHRSTVKRETAATTRTRIRASTMPVRIHGRPQLQSPLGNSGDRGRMILVRDRGSRLHTREKILDEFKVSIKVLNNAKGNFDRSRYVDGN